MTLNTGLMSSNRDDWPTPLALFNELDREFNFTLDVCASADNHKVAKYFDKDTDGLRQDWTKDICFMNPPYGRTIGQWVKKASDSARDGAIVVGLLPARTETNWFKYCQTATELRFIMGRVTFEGAESSAPFPSVIVVWGTPRVPVVKWVNLPQKITIEDPPEKNGIVSVGYRSKKGNTNGGITKP